MADVSTSLQYPPPVRFIRNTRALIENPRSSASRNCSVFRSKSVGCFDTCVQDKDHDSGAQFCAGDIVATSRTSCFATITESRRAEPSCGGGLCRSASMSHLQQSRPDYNRSVGEALANSPKKRPANTNQDISIMVELLLGL